MRRSKALKLRDNRRLKRKRRVRGRISGTPEMPRVTIYKSNKYIIVQAIDDIAGNTLAFLNTAHLEEKLPSNIEGAKKAAAIFAEKLKAANIEKVAFDRNGYKYHGVVAAFADSLRENGIKL
ncbi:50S ribosomal protein L18 [Caminibacter mediatlanticus TB-2]|uniref:Large ribosomal subunit protein uL18 n=2 Tax=Caminibacter mediatlanticus TB-2 TaxID=391592 RepID=A0ABX5VB17_9BACT|nr:50S ribosomal protein L18 [Caminibacter mediatlanticus]QCT93996.1 50S ribosomal protein L18 [Caminibacter mediatlanticus TB-2]